MSEASESTQPGVVKSVVVVDAPAADEEDEETDVGSGVGAAKRNNLSTSNLNSRAMSEVDDPGVLSMQVNDSSLSAMLGPGGRELLPEIIQASLSTLGHNRSGRVVYTTVSLASLSLSSVDALSAYNHLQKVILDSNQLTTLAPLKQFESLCHVSASANKLEDDVFDALAASASSLEFLDVSGNCLTSLSGLPQLKYIRTLRVSQNKLTKIQSEDFANAKSLSVFAAAGNKIDHVDGDAFIPTPIRSINLSQNQLSDLTCFLPLKDTLSTLSVSDNNIMHFDIVTAMKRLHTLELAGNNAYDIGEVHALAKLSSLRTVTLLNNPLCSLYDNANRNDSDDDAASDIVQPDEAAAGASSSAETAQETAPELDDSKQPTLTPTKPSVIGGDGLKARSLTNRRERQDAAITSAQMFVSPDDDLAALTPQEEDKIQFLTADSESQYRLRVLWRAPNITQLDGTGVQPEELSHAKKLEGGATRENRANARSQFITSGGSAAFALRSLTRHRDAPAL